MSNPFEVLGVPADADDESIRRRYLELVKQFSPEKHPEKFSAVRQAYESLRDLNTRLKYQVFEAGKNETIEALVEELACRSTRRRIPLKQLLSVLDPS